MRCIWDSKATGVSGGDVQGQIERDYPTALTTVLTTLDRLREKKIVRRERDGKSFRYWANVSEEELQQRIVGGVLDRLIAQFPRAVAAYFAQQGPDDAVTDQNATLMELALRIEGIQSATNDAHD